MAKHPLDISSFLGLDPKDISKPKKKFKNKPKVQNHTDQKPENLPPAQSPIKSSHEGDEAPRIEKQYWQQLNPESRRIFTSRMWKHVDFNPMLSELTDLSKLTEKWLRWAIPTYANGIKEGPIKDWFDGVQGDRDFHYVLVGEHLKHLKEIRQKRKEEPQNNEVEVVTESDSPIATATDTEVIASEEPTPPAADAAEAVFQETECSPAEETTNPPEEAEAPEKPVSPELKMAMSDLDDHIKWFQKYLDGNAAENDPEKN